MATDVIEGMPVGISDRIAIELIEAIDREGGQRLGADGAVAVLNAVFPMFRKFTLSRLDFSIDPGDHDNWVVRMTRVVDGYSKTAVLETTGQVEAFLRGVKLAFELGGVEIETPPAP